MNKQDLIKRIEDVKTHMADVSDWMASQSSPTVLDELETEYNDYKAILKKLTKQLEDGDYE